MPMKETLNEGLKRGYTFTVTADSLEAKVKEKLIEAQPEVEMKGFRKGKVPMALLKKQFGPRLIGETMQDAIDLAMTTHFEKSGDRPAGRPDVKISNEDWKEGDDIHVEMSYEALPDIPDADLKGLQLERLVVKADDAAIEDALKNLAETAQNFEDRKAGSKAQDGDQVVMDFSGKVDGKVFDGGSADDFPLVLGSNSFIPGFEDQLVGAKADEAITVNVSFPADYQAKNLAGKDAVFDCTIKTVKKPIAAEINDDLGKQFGADNLAGLKIQISERLEEEYKGAARALMKRETLDQLDKMVTFELPPSLLEAEAKQIAHQLWHEDHPEDEGHDHDHDHGEAEVTDEHRELAERRVRLGLLLAELGRKAKVEVSESEMSQAIMNQARQYPGQEREFFEFVKKNEQMQQQMRAPIFEDKVIDYINELATVTDKEVSKDELETALKNLEED